jgi:hypothetical protein
MNYQAYITSVRVSHILIRFLADNLSIVITRIRAHMLIHSLIQFVLHILIRIPIHIFTHIITYILLHILIRIPIRILTYPNAILIHILRRMLICVPIYMYSCPNPDSVSSTLTVTITRICIHCMRHLASASESVHSGLVALHPKLVTSNLPTSPTRPHPFDIYPPMQASSSPQLSLDPGLIDLQQP